MNRCQLNSCVRFRPVGKPAEVGSRGTWKHPLVSGWPAGDGLLCRSSTTQVPDPGVLAFFRAVSEGTLASSREPGMDKGFREHSAEEQPASLA